MPTQKCTAPLHRINNINIFFKKWTFIVFPIIHSILMEFKHLILINICVIWSSDFKPVFICIITQKKWVSSYYNFLNEKKMYTFFSEASMSCDPLTPNQCQIVIPHQTISASFILSNYLYFNSNMFNIFHAMWSCDSIQMLNLNPRFPCLLNKASRFLLWSHAPRLI